ncbi:MAG: TonB-dependent receptor, partial [Acidobacteriota bacterium]
MGAILICVALLLAPARLPAQVLYGSLVGNVTDPSGSAVARAKVTVVSQETNLTRETMTNEEGQYSFPGIPAGVYTVKVAMAGFGDFGRSDVPVTLNSTSRLNAALQLGHVQATVEVTAQAAPLLQTDRAEVRLEMTTKKLESLPVAQGRNYQALFRSLPGFIMNKPENNSASNPSMAYQFSVNGASRSINNTRVDGATSTNVWLPHMNGAYVPALESIETVNVVTNSFDAEQGLAGGAAISVQIKSGTNQFHGSVFEYADNSILRSRSYFLPSNQNKAKLVYHQTGGTIGGRIIRDKLFFFNSFERTSDHQSANLLTSVPSAPVRGGDFSGFSAMVYDPLTGKPDGSERTPFTGNRIPASRISPIATKIMGMVPAANQTTGGTTEQNNFFAAAPFMFNRWTDDVKINWVAAQNVNLFGRYSILGFDLRSPTAFGDILEGPGMSGKSISSPGDANGGTHSISSGVNYIVAPTLLIDANFGFVRQPTNMWSRSSSKNYGLDLLGIPGTNGPAEYQGGMPRFDVGGYGFYGIANHYTPYYRIDDQFQYVTNATWTKKTHELRWGMDVYRQTMNHTQPEFVGGASMGPRGRFVFGTGPTQLCQTPDGRGGCSRTSTSDSRANSFGTFLLGMPTQLGKCIETLTPYTTRVWQYSFYVRDRWQVSRKLTFSFGTRWEYFPMPTRADRGFERYNPDTNMMEIGGVGSVPVDLGVRNSKRLFAPRVGLAYRATDKFVIRAGYGLTNDPYSLSRPMRTNHPVLVELNVTAPNSLSSAGRLADGIPPVPVPSLGSGIIPVPENVTANTIPTIFERGYIQSWNLMLERNLGGGFVAEAGYVATRQIRQLGFRELNWAPIGGGSAGRQLFKQFGRTASTNLVTPIGGTHYDSLQTRLQRRFSSFYMLDASYTWSKSITTSGQDNSDGGLSITIPEYYGLNRRTSGLDRTHNLEITNVTELPFGKG